ncbi:Chalcone--flavanone isomerase [Euphorbia peplus]|nr:Chalcone--flavanone isomerase [Euphorbia peplus]
MASAVTTPIKLDNVFFPSAVKPPASKKSLFLAGAGVRGMEIEGKFTKFTAIGVYLEEEAVSLLTVKWKGKNADELTDSVEFFREIVTGPFEKFVRVTMILPLSGQEYSKKVTENCVGIWKSMGIYSEAEAKGINRFLDIFKDKQFPPGSSILFTHLPNGSIAITFWKEGSMPEVENGVIENKLLSEAVLESIVGKQGVSPAARGSIGSRLAELLVEKSTVQNRNSN